MDNSWYADKLGRILGGPGLRAAAARIEFTALRCFDVFSGMLRIQALYKAYITPKLKRVRFCLGGRRPRSKRPSAEVVWVSYVAEIHQPTLAATTPEGWVLVPIQP